MDLAEWTWYDWLLQVSDYRCPITANCPITPSDYNCTEWLVKYKTADAPITFEEIVMVMIRTKIREDAESTYKNSTLYELLTNLRLWKGLEVNTRKYTRIGSIAPFKKLKIRAFYFLVSRLNKISQVKSIPRYEVSTSMKKSKLLAAIRNQQSCVSYKRNEKKFLWQQTYLFESQ